MKRAKRSTTLAVFVLAIMAHGLLVAMLTLERPELVFRRPTGEPPAIAVTLTPPPVVQPRPRRLRRKPEHAAAVAPSAPQPPAPVAAGDLPNLARPVFRVWPRALPGGVNWGSAVDSCDNPVRPLTPEERERCRKRWGSQEQQIAEIPPLIDKEGRIEFDRRIHCRDKYENAPVPIGAAETARETLGSSPSFRECPPADR
jgi:hypothetical protein